MSKLDEYVLTTIKEKINLINETEGRKAKPMTNIYKKYDSTFTSTSRSIKKLIEKNGHDSRKWDEETKEKHRILTEKNSRARKSKINVPYLDKKTGHYKNHIHTLRG
jgi:hypothetical protein